MTRADLHFIRRAIERLTQRAEQRVLSDPSQRVWNAAMAQAARDVSDEVAATALRLDIDDIPSDVLDREVRDASFRDQYLDDRAYRLLVAAHRGGPVAPIEPRDRTRFEKEAILGRLPLPEAFRRLAETEPELRRLEEVALTGKKVRSRELGRLVGPTARGSDAALQGEPALLVALLYLRACANGSGDVRSLFERSRHVTRGTVHVRPMDE